MSDIIELFMWGYQRHFQRSLQFEATKLFDKIDNRLDPILFLIGLLVDDRADRHKICLEPEDCGYRIEAFRDVEALANELEKVDEESKIHHSHPIAQERHSVMVGNNALISALHKILKSEDIYSKTFKYISYPTYVDGFLVFVVLEIDKTVIRSHYSLTNSMYNDRFKISRSFIESTIDTFLKECSDALMDPNKGFKSIKREPEELLRESAKQFMYSISQAGDTIDGLHGLYESCNMIASLKYEGGEGLGKMAIAKKDHINIRLTLELEQPIKIKDYRKVRKFLELSTDDSIIISDSALIYGLGEIVGKYNPKEESLFIIHFISHYKWEVLHDNISMLVVIYEQPNIPKEVIDRDKFYSDLSRIFKDINKRQLDDLWEIANQATTQKHGTMLVISDNAQKESARLGKQCFSLRPMKLNSKVISQITSIDGAVLLDRDSICYSIGVILDGLATDKGDSSRGARYNSAIRYYENFKNESALALIIISEDGMINIIPSLKPQIDHTEIESRIEELTQLNLLDKADRVKYYPLINWFEDHRFYLTSDECQIINDTRKDLEKKENEPASIRIVRNDLRPNDEMNDSYYIK
jgi:DNA integrity scanning protein DisA with diadenylate cyclase activity